MMNLYANITKDLDEEVADLLIQHDGVRIERIVSSGQSSPEGFWYDQDDHEWVVVLQGEGEVVFDDNETVFLKPGDHLFIPARRKHRVSYTSANEPTLWLAIFFPPQPGG